MNTKAIIISKSPDTSNKFLVRIPIFENVGNSGENMSKSEPLYEAALCYVPGNLSGYKPGDVVYISFENNDLSNIFILGKLWTGSEEEITASIQAQRLVVNGSTELDGNVKVNGVMLSTVNENKQAIEDLLGITDDSKIDIEEVKKEVKELNKKIKFKDWVIEQSGNNLNFYRLFKTED